MIEAKMDIKVTKKRLLNLINYEWIKTLIFIIIGIIVWNLLFTTLGTRLTDGQSFYLVTFEGVNTKTYDVNSKFLNKLRTDGILSYDVLSLGVTEVNTVGSYSADYMFSVRMSTKEGDVLVVGEGDKPYDEEKGEIYAAQRIVSNYMHSLFTIDEFLDAAHNYTVKNGFITEYDGGYTVNEQAIESYFKNERIQSARNYRRTYTSEAKINEGVLGEIERIKNIYTSWLGVTAALEKAAAEGNDIRWYSKPIIKNDDGSLMEFEPKAYGIDLDKMIRNRPEGKEDLIDLWYVLDEQEQTSTAGLVFMIFNFSGVQADMQYESLSVLYYLIRTYSGYAD
ncbi:MAG: hypothetical protein J5903_04285 [Clostridia bacterium]|nr:hypothetical protein [Clostridia bacterium]